MAFDPETFQGQVMRWTMHNFPRAQKHQPLLGIVEEVGELFDALEQQDEPSLADAAGDVMIFLAHFSGMNGFVMMQCAQAQREAFDRMITGTHELPLKLVQVVGKLSHAFLKDEQHIRMNERHRDRMMECIGSIVRLLDLICQAHSIDLTQSVERAWGEVSKRDWAKFPKNGVTDDVKLALKDKKPLKQPGSAYPIPKERWSGEVPF